MATARIGQVVGRVADFFSGAERVHHPSSSLEYLEEGAELFLVTYGPYGILPSFDPDCLAAIVSVPFELEPSNEPEMSPDGKLPFMMFSNGKTIREQDIQHYGDAQRGVLLESQEAFISTVLDLLEKSIRPALLATLWLEAPLCTRTTKRNYSRNYPWPISEYLMWRKQRAIRNEFLDGKTTMAQLVSSALEALRTLSELLGDREYFGHPVARKSCKPSDDERGGPGYCDALAYGLFAVALVILPPCHELRTMIETCSSLRAFVGRIRRELFD